MCRRSYALAGLSVNFLGLFLALFFGLGCSSKADKAKPDGSAGASEAGTVIDAKAIDSRIADGGGPGLDGARGQDARDTRAVDSSPLDVGGVLDARDARDVNSLLDGPRDVPDAKDGAADRGDAVDTPQVGDTNSASMDGAIDSAPLGSCAFPIDIPPGFTHADIAVSTTQSNHILDIPCADNGADVVLRFAVRTQQPQLIYADTFGAAWNTILYFSDACNRPKPPASTGDDTITCNDDACNTGQSQVYAVLGYGWHYLIVSGANGESGDVTVHIEAAVLGNGPATLLTAGSGSVQGTTSGIDRSSLCESAGPKNCYWWPSCPDYAGGSLLATTCKGTDWDTVLSLQVPRTNIVACNDDDTTCGMQSTINALLPPGAGIQVLTVGGAVGNSLGDYTLTYSRP